MRGIYEIRNIYDNKVYVGSTKDDNRRKRDHFRKLKSNTHDNDYLKKSFNKSPKSFPQDSFHFLREIPYDDNLSKKENDTIMAIAEQEELNKYIVEGKIDKDKCYNLAPDVLYHTHSDETLKKIRDGNRGKIISEESRKKMSASAVGKIVSEETRAKISENSSKLRHSDDSKQKMSNIKKEWWDNHPEQKEKLGQRSKEMFNNNPQLKENIRNIGFSNKGNDYNLGKKINRKNCKFYYFDKSKQKWRFKYKGIKWTDTEQEIINSIENYKQKIILSLLDSIIEK